MPWVREWPPHSANTSIWQLEAGSYNRGQEMRPGEERIQPLVPLPAPACLCREVERLLQLLPDKGRWPGSHGAGGRPLGCSGDPRPQSKVRKDSRPHGRSSHSETAGALGPAGARLGGRWAGPGIKPAGAEAREKILRMPQGVREQREDPGILGRPSRLSLSESWFFHQPPDDRPPPLPP